MPIKSKAQRRKFAELLVEGKIAPETFEEWNRGAGSKELPERLHPKPARKTARKRARKPVARKAAARTRTRTSTRKTATSKTSRR